MAKKAFLVNLDDRDQQRLETIRRAFGVRDMAKTFRHAIFLADQQASGASFLKDAGFRPPVVVQEFVDNLQTLDHTITTVQFVHIAYTSFCDARNSKPLPHGVMFEAALQLAGLPRPDGIHYEYGTTQAVL